MLVLSRKKNESIIIGDNIRISVIAIRGDRVQLGFAAPAEIPIHREEIYRELQQLFEAESHDSSYEAESALRIPVVAYH